MLENEKYILLTTYRRDGTPVATPVWLVALGEGKFGFWTSSASGKAKRLAHTDRVTIQACDARGRLKRGSEAVSASAELVAGPEFAAIQAAIRAKYGVLTKITKVLATLGGLFKGKRIPYGDRGVVITLAA